MTRSDGWRLACFRRAPARAIGIEQRLAELSEQAAILADAVHQIVLEESDQAGADLQFWADAVGACIESHRRDLGATRAASLEARLKSLAEAARSTALSMEFDFLLDPDRLLLSIGYQGA